MTPRIYAREVAVFEQGSRPGSRLNGVWRNMRRRCDSPARAAFKYYGARGIYVCAEWATFLPFLDWALCNGYEVGKQLDRIDADGPYSPHNCRWVSQQINVRRRELDRKGQYIAALDGKMTKAAIETAEPRATGYKLADGQGLTLLIRPTGSKSWQFRYRFDGKERLLSLGPYPHVSLADARELHAIARAQLERGRSPAEIKQATRRRRAR